MSQFILLYKGPTTPMEEMTSENNENIAKEWQDWMDGIGESLVDMGSPMHKGLTIFDDGTEDVATEITGYSIIEADSLEEAKKLLYNHPFLSDSSGDYAVEIFELQPIVM